MEQLDRELQTCWYCRRSPADERLAVAWPMYRQLPPGSPDTVRWERLTLRVPRCPRCRRVQAWLTATGIVLAAPLPLYYLVWSLREFPSGVLQWILWALIRVWILGAGILFFVLCMWILAWPGRLIARLLRTRLAPTSPTLKKLRGDGWRRGTRPPGVDEKTVVQG